MKGLALSLVVLTMNVAPTIAQKIGTETSDRTRIVHLKTALNHLSVIDGVRDIEVMIWSVSFFGS
jgi:hypothetical protein